MTQPGVVGFSVPVADDVISVLDKIQGNLDSYYGDEDKSFAGMRADFDMDGTDEEMDVNHDLLLKAKAEVIECITALRTTTQSQKDIAIDTMARTKTHVSAARA